MGDCFPVFGCGSGDGMDAGFAFLGCCYRGCYGAGGSMTLPYEGEVLGWLKCGGGCDRIEEKREDLAMKLCIVVAPCKAG